MKSGEWFTAYTIVTELAKHRELPITVLGSNKEGRPSINVTLTTSIGEADTDVLQEYKNGRAYTIREGRNHETHHFAFEWIAPASVLSAIHLEAFSGMICDGDTVIDLELMNIKQCNNLSNPPIVRSAQADGLDGCVVTLYRTRDCDPGGSGAELFLDEDDICEQEPLTEFRCRSYDVSCL